MQAAAQLCISPLINKRFTKRKSEGRLDGGIHIVVLWALELSTLSEVSDRLLCGKNHSLIPSFIEIIRLLVALSNCCCFLSSIGIFVLSEIYFLLLRRIEELSVQPNWCSENTGHQRWSTTAVLCKLMAEHCGTHHRQPTSLGPSIERLLFFSFAYVRSCLLYTRNNSYYRA